MKIGRLLSLLCVLILIFAASAFAEDGEDISKSSGAPAVDIRPLLGDSPIVGYQDVCVQATPDIDFVRFFFDGALQHKDLSREDNGDFCFDSNFGEYPRRHVVRVVGYSTDGVPIAEVYRVFNDPFNSGLRVRVVSPATGKIQRGSIPVRVVVEHPSPPAIDSVSLFISTELSEKGFTLGDKVGGDLYTPPFIWRVQLPEFAETPRPVQIRVLARFGNGVAVEDVRVFNASGYGYSDEIRVDEVTVFVSAPEGYLKNDTDSKPSLNIQEKVGLGKGKWTDIPKEDIVYCSGEFNVHLGLLIDTSASMKQGGLVGKTIESVGHFLDDFLSSTQRTIWAMSFSDFPQVIIRPTADLQLAKQTLGGILPGFGTDVPAAIEAGMYYGGGFGEKQAVVIMTNSQRDDMYDKNRMSFVADYARRSGVAVYIVAIDFPKKQKELLKDLAEVSRITGGRTFEVSSENIGQALRQVLADIESQYMVVYRKPFPQVSGWREIKVSIDGERVNARSGYEPW